MAQMATDLDTDSASAHALFLSYGGMEGVPEVVAAPTAATRLGRWGVTLSRAYPGFAVAATIAVAATWLSQHYAAPVMLFALLIGMAFHFLHEEGRCIPGIEFSSKTILRLGVALLGAKITVSQIVGLGVMPIATVVVAVVSTITVGAIAARALGLSRAFGILSGGAVGICGASAALAIASVLPKNPEAERDTILTVVVVTALSTLAMILYPLIAVGLGLDHTQAGIFIGGAIHDVAQVVGAGYSISPRTGDVATYVKLLRVTLLLPVVFTIALTMRSATTSRRAPPLPMFLVGFAVLVAVNSLGLLSKPMVDAASILSRGCLVTAIAALGMKTSFKALATAGWRPVALMIGETAWILTVVLVSVKVFG